MALIKCPECGKEIRNMKRRKVFLKVILCISLMLISSIGAAAAADVAINSTNFPDANFRSFVSTTFDVNQSGYLSEREIKAVREIDCSNSNVSNLTGIKYFTELEKLNCSNNSITALNIAGMNKLKDMDCSNNGMTSINVTSCSNLECLRIYNNSLSVINLDSAPSLRFIYEKEPRHRFGAGISAFGVVEKGINNEESFRVPFLIIDDSTIVDGATPAAYESGIPGQISGRNLSMEGFIKLRFFLNLPDTFINDEGAYVLIDNMVYDVASARQNDGRYLFEADIAAAQICDRVLLSLMTGDGTPYPLLDKEGVDVTGGYSFSVEEYVNLVHASVDTSIVKNMLLVTMLDYMSEYGKYAQDFFDYDDEELQFDAYFAYLMNKVTINTLDEYQENHSNVDGVGIAYKTSSLELRSCTCLNNFFELSGKSISDFRYFVDGNEITTQSTGDYRVTTDGNRVKLIIDNISAAEIGKMHTVVIKDLQGAAVADLSICALSYSYKVLSKSGDDALIKTMKALYLYYIAAKEYFDYVR